MIRCLKPSCCMAALRPVLCVMPSSWLELPCLQAVKDGPAWAVDAWGLGCLMQEVYSGQPLARTEDLRNTGGSALSVASGRGCTLGKQPCLRQLFQGTSYKAYRKTDVLLPVPVLSAECSVVSSHEL